MFKVPPSPPPLKKRAPVFMALLAGALFVGALVVAGIGYAGYKFIKRHDGGSGPSSNASQPLPPKTNASAQEIGQIKMEMSALGSSLLDARMRGDVDALDRFLSDDYHENDSDYKERGECGPRMTKAQILEEARRRASGAEPPLGYSVQKTVVDFDDKDYNAGTVTIAYSVSGTEQGRKVAEKRWSIFVVHKYRDGWKATVGECRLGVPTFAATATPTPTPASSPSQSQPNSNSDQVKRFQELFYGARGTPRPSPAKRP